MIIRAASPADHDAIRRINITAFPTPGEADLVDALRAGGHAVAEWVVEEAGAVIGHILFSRLDLVGERDTLFGAALAPMAVTPDRQRTGVGRRLIAAGIEACRRESVAAVVVLGHPGYYPRHGFSAEAAARLHDPFGAGPAFMALELDDGALGDPRRPVYAPPFGVNGD